LFESKWGESPILISFQSNTPPSFSSLFPKGDKPYSSEPIPGRGDGAVLRETTGAGLSMG